MFFVCLLIVLATYLQEIIKRENVLKGGVRKSRDVS